MKYTKEERKARRKALFAKIKAWFKNLDDVILPKANELALKWMNAIKNVTDSNVLDFVTNAIPGETDDKVLEKVREITTKAVFTLELTSSCMDEEDLFKKLVCIVEKIRTLPKNERALKWNSLHAFALSEFDDNKEEIAVYLAQAPIDFLNQEIA